MAKAVLGGSGSDTYAGAGAGAARRQARLQQVDLTLGGLQAGGQQAQQGVLAGARGADDGHPFAGLTWWRIDIFQRDLAVAGQAHATQGDVILQQPAARAASVS